MTRNAPTPDPDLAMLDELVDMTFAHVESLRARIMATADPRARSELVRLYARGVREINKTVALRARMARARAEAERAAEAKARAVALEAFRDATPGPTRH